LLAALDLPYESGVRTCCAFPWHRGRPTTAIADPSTSRRNTDAIVAGELHVKVGDIFTVGKDFNTIESVKGAQQFSRRRRQDLQYCDNLE
jgi:hypothetical protein